MSARKPRTWTVIRRDGYGFGRTCISDTGLSVAFIAGRFAAGDSIAALAKDYRLPEAAIVAALRGMCQSMFSTRGLLKVVERNLDAIGDTNQAQITERPKKGSARGQG